MIGKPKATDPSPERRLAAILAVKVDGYSPLMSNGGEADHITRGLTALQDAIRRASGSVFSFLGDSVVAEFNSITGALRCALRFQAESADRMQASAEPICLRMGIAVGEILAGGRHIGGKTINLAADLAGVSPAGGIALTSALHEEIRHAISVQIMPMGQPVPPGPDQPVAVVCISPQACLAWAGHSSARRRAKFGRAPDPRASLAVVPLRADHPHDALARAVTEDVIRRFGGLATWLAVTPMPATVIRAPIDLFRLRGTAGARYILSGRIEAERTMLRLSVELSEALTGRALWSDRFDHTVGENDALRQDAASRITCAIPPLLLQRELECSALIRPAKLAAHDLALRAFTAVMQPERESLRLANDLLVLAGPHASAHFVRVWWHLVTISQGGAADLRVEAAAISDAAGGMDRDDPGALALSAFLQSVLHHDHALAVAMLDRVIDSFPACAMAWTLKSLTLCRLGEGTSAISHAEQAQTMPLLGPERAWRDYVTALAHYVAGRYGDAVHWARVSAEEHSGIAANARVLAASLAVLGRLDDAHRAAMRILAIDPAFKISAWQARSLLPDEYRAAFARRLRLAGLPG